MVFQILRTRQVMELLGVGRTTLWRWSRKGIIPKPVRLGPRAVGWRADELQDWLDRLPPAGPSEGVFGRISSSDSDQDTATGPTL